MGQAFGKIGFLNQSLNIQEEITGSTRKHVRFTMSLSAHDQKYDF